MDDFDSVCHGDIVENAVTVAVTVVLVDDKAADVTRGVAHTASTTATTVNTTNEV